jgi:16S rRNA (adenine1518-N6/adenine1519-N6)-dimethyltransferase
MSLLERTKLLLREHRIIPNKLLGQNFMIEQSLFETLADHASLNKNDTVLDAGAGFGFLTRFLASKCKKVVAVEADNRLAGILRERLNDLTNVETIRGNVLKVQVPEFNKVVSIPPYQISSRLLPWLFSRSFECAVLIFQKEFADRLVAPVGSEDYGWLTVLTYYKTDCELLDRVPKDLFFPQPEVDSIVIRLTRKEVSRFALKDELLFKKLARSLFSQRNRKVRNAIKPFLTGVLARAEEDAAKTVETIPFRDKRVRELAPEDFGALANALA